MMLADMGADVITLDRLGAKKNQKSADRARTQDHRTRSQGHGPEAQRSIFLDKADALIEGFRPGVMERLGLGPDVCWRAIRASSMAA